LGVARSAQAQGPGPYSIQELLDGAFIECDDKIFDNWRNYTSSGAGGAPPNGIEAATIFVTCTINPMFEGVVLE
jgi:hypothetical protein